MPSVLLISGCDGIAFSQHDGNRYYKAAIDSFPVANVRVDDASGLRDSVHVEPGMHRISVQAPPGGAHRYGDQQTVMLAVKLGARDWIFTVRNGSLASKFTVEVDCEEAIGACRSPD